MKNIFKFTLLFNVCFCSLLCNVSLADVQNKNAEFPQPSVKITFDSRIELLATVQFLSDYDKRFRLITRFDFPYKQHVRKHFSEYKNHPAVKFFDQMSADGFSFDAPPAAMLYLSDVPFDQLGFATDLPATAPPEETHKVITKLPFVLGGMAAFMTGTALYTHRQHDASPSNSTEGNQAPANEGPEKPEG